MKKLSIICIGAVFVAGLLAASAEAQLIVDPSKKAATGQFEFGDVFCISKTEYEAEFEGESDSGDVDRTLIGAYGAYGINDLIDIYGAAGYIIKAEPEDWDDDGNGFVIAAGARAQIMEMDALTILGYGQLHYGIEDYGEGSGVESEGTLAELALGAVARYSLMDELYLYGGLDIVPYSDGEIEMSGGGDSFNADVERDNIIGIRLGANYDFGKWWLRGEFALVSEEAITIGGGMLF